MAYVLTGVTMEVPAQAMRPREPGRPARAVTLSTPGMSNRWMRPREGLGALGVAVSQGRAAVLTPTAQTKAVTTAVQATTRAVVTAPPDAHALLLDLTAHKGQQAYLEALLKKLGTLLAQCQAQATSYGRAGQTALAQTYTAAANAIQQDIALCIQAVKECAASANAAAAGAMQKGAPPALVQRVAVIAADAGNTAGTTSTPTDVANGNANSGGGVAVGDKAPVTVLPTFPDEFGPPGTGPGGPNGGGASVDAKTGQPVDTPPIADPGVPSTNSTPSTSSSGGGGGLLLLGGAALLAFFVLRSRK